MFGLLTSGPRVMVVDDDAVIVLMLSRLLPRHGYHVEAFADSARALDRFKEGGRFAVVLCDIVMPVLSGPMLYRRVEEIDSAQASRFVFMTAGVPEEGPSRAFVDGWQEEVLSKPFDPFSLLGLVREKATA